MDDAFAKWVEAARAKGYSDEQIKAAAIKGGRTAEEVDAVLHAPKTPPTMPSIPPAVVSAPVSQTAPSSLEMAEKEGGPTNPDVVKPKKVDKTLEIVAIVLVVLAVIGIGGYFIFAKMVTGSAMASDAGSNAQEEDRAETPPAEEPSTDESPEETDEEPPVESDLYCHVDLDGFWTYAVPDVEENRCTVAEDCVEKMVTEIEVEFKDAGMGESLYGPMVDNLRSEKEAQLADGKIICVAGDPNE